MAIEIILVDDHAIVRQGIKAILSREPDIRIVGEASNGEEALEAVKVNRPDVVVMDITLPVLNGLEASRRILKANKNIKIVILSMHENRVFAEKALSYGVKGYVLKDSAADEIVQAIREVCSGQYFLSSKISSFVVEDYLSKKKQPQASQGISKLTGREREILQCIAEGLSSKEIANKLKLALKTVLVHRNNISRKLNVHNQAQLTRLALKEGLISL